METRQEKEPENRAQPHDQVGKDSQAPGVGDGQGPLEEAAERNSQSGSDGEGDPERAEEADAAVEVPENERQQGSGFGNNIVVAYSESDELEGDPDSRPVSGREEVADETEERLPLYWHIKIPQAGHQIDLLQEIEDNDGVEVANSDSESESSQGQEADEADNEADSNESDQRPRSTASSAQQSGDETSEDEDKHGNIQKQEIPITLFKPVLNHFRLDTLRTEAVDISDGPTFIRNEPLDETMGPLFSVMTGNTRRTTRWRTAHAPFAQEKTADAFHSAVSIYGLPMAVILDGHRHADSTFIKMLAERFMDILQQLTIDLTGKNLSEEQINQLVREKYVELNKSFNQDSTLFDASFAATAFYQDRRGSIKEVSFATGDCMIVRCYKASSTVEIVDKKGASSGASYYNPNYAAAFSSISAVDNSAIKPPEARALVVSDMNDSMETVVRAIKVEQGEPVKYRPLRFPMPHENEGAPIKRALEHLQVGVRTLVRGDRFLFLTDGAYREFDPSQQVAFDSTGIILRIELDPQAFDPATPVSELIDIIGNRELEKFKDEVKKHNDSYNFFTSGDNTTIGKVVVPDIHSQRHMQTVFFNKAKDYLSQHVQAISDLLVKDKFESISIAILDLSREQDADIPSLTKALIKTADLLKCSTTEKNIDDYIAYAKSEVQGKSSPKWQALSALMLAGAVALGLVLSLVYGASVLASAGMALIPGALAVAGFFSGPGYQKGLSKQLTNAAYLLKSTP